MIVQEHTYLQGLIMMPFQRCGCYTSYTYPFWHHSSDLAQRHVVQPLDSSLAAAETLTTSCPCQTSCGSDSGGSNRVWSPSHLLMPIIQQQFWHDSCLLHQKRLSLPTPRLLHTEAQFKNVRELQETNSNCGYYFQLFLR